MFGQLFEGVLLFLVILNPFLLSVYLLELIEKLSFSDFAKVLVRASGISLVVFTLFAISGDAIFDNVLHVRFAAFQVFGGVIFTLIALQYLLQGSSAIAALRGDAAHLAGAVAMPFMIGPGTISASVVIGARGTPLTATLALILALVVAVTIVLVLKFIHDRVRARRAELIRRYVEITGRVGALLIGTIAVEMIFQGIERWHG